MTIFTCRTCILYLFLLDFQNWLTQIMLHPHPAAASVPQIQIKIIFFRKKSVKIPPSLPSHHLACLGGLLACMMRWYHLVTFWAQDALLYSRIRFLKFAIMCTLITSNCHLSCNVAPLRNCYQAAIYVRYFNTTM